MYFQTSILQVGGYKMESLVQNFRLETELHFQAKKIRNHYPVRLRELAVACLQEGRSSGFSLNRVANLLGVGSITLKKWSTSQEPRVQETSTQLVPVVITPTKPSGIRIVTSSGIFSEFDCVEQAAEFFRLLQE
jgi:hypothetical protein|tara:strand:- start:1925 stop:2326 length:402 start_codon:yes stop_codon:yes gene_type:complete